MKTGIWSRAFRAVVAGAVLCTTAMAQDVPPPSAKGPVYVVTFVEVDPAAQQRAVGALKQYRDAARSERAILSADIYRERGQQNRFMLLEMWREQPDFDTHIQGPNAKRLENNLAPIELSPPDLRTHRGFLVGPHLNETGENGVYVMTHLDVAPPAFAPLQMPLRPYVEATRKETGLLRYDILQHTEPRQNHLTIIEGWRNRQAFDAHNAAQHTRKFRDEVGPMLGALYDQRLYTRLQ